MIHRLRAWLAASQLTSALTGSSLRSEQAQANAFAFARTARRSAAIDR